MCHARPIPFGAFVMLLSWPLILLCFFSFPFNTREHIPCENEVGFIGTVLEFSGTHFNGTFWDNH